MCEYRIRLPAGLSLWLKEFWLHVSEVVSQYYRLESTWSKVHRLIITKSMEQNHSRESDNHSAGKESTGLFGLLLGTQ